MDWTNYPTALPRVQVTAKTSTNITRYLYSRWNVRQVCLLLTNQLARFPVPIPFHFRYLCHTFPVNKYLIRCFVVWKYCWEFLLVVCVLTRPTGLSKYSTTHKNTQRYYTTKHLIRYIYCILTCNSLRQLLVRSWWSWCGIQSDFLSFYLVGVCFCSDRLQNGISDDEAMLTNVVVCM